MAEGGRQTRRARRSREDDNGGPGIGTLLAAGAIAAGVGAVVYGAKKLFEYVSEEKAAAEKESGCYRPPPNERPGGNFSGVPADPGRHRPLQGDTRRVIPGKPEGNKRSLAEVLEEYYREYVSVAGDEMQRILLITEEVKKFLLMYLQREHSGLGVMSFENHGSIFEDLAVVSADQVDLLLTTRLDTNMWALVTSNDVGLEAPGYFGIKRINLEEHPLGSHPYDEFVEDMYLSRELVTNAYRMAVADATSVIDRYDMASEVEPDLITMTANDSTGTTALRINILPAICLCGKLVTSRSHPGLHMAAEHQILWQASFAAQESQRLRAMDPKKCCHLKCLKIIKSIRLNHPTHFGMVPSYVYKTILLHMMADTPEEDFWAPECLQEQFVDFLNQLIFYLQGRSLPSVGDGGINLLEGTSPEVCDGLVSFITTRIGKEKLCSLLDERAGTLNV